MADVLPFRGLRYDPARIGELGAVLCPPYDVVDNDGERRLLDAHPNNAIRVELAGSSVRADSDARYSVAATTLESWIRDGIVRRDETASYYLHECTFGHAGETRSRLELIAAARLEPWERRVVLPHEHTFPGAKADRLRLLESTRANISPILAFFPRGGSDDAFELVRRWISRRAPVAEVVDLDGIGHRLWILDDPALAAGLRAFFASRQLFIADGHHRYETALEYRRRVVEGGGPIEDSHPANFVMMHLVAEDDPGLVVLPIHRLLAGLDGLHAEGLEERLSAAFHLEYFPIWPDAPPGQIDAFLSHLSAQGRARQTLGVFGPDPTLFALLTPREQADGRGSPPSDRQSAWRHLDVVLADVGIVQPLLGERGLRTESAVTYTRDAHEAFAAVRRGECQVAVILNPTRVDQIAEVALAGERMPEKSTYFFPKAPTGLVFRRLE